MSLDQQGVSSIPQRYVLPPSQRPSPPYVPITTTLPIIDLSTLQDQSLRSQTINEIRIACKEIGFFQVNLTRAQFACSFLILPIKNDTPIVGRVNN